MTDSHLATDRVWPYRPDFDQFKRQAKELLKSYRAGDANAVAEVQRHEQASTSNTSGPATFALHDAQRVLARSYGFTSWQKLKSYVQTIQPYWRPLEPKSDDDANRFLRLACITYFDGDHPSRRVRARQLFAEKPRLAKANIYTAAAVGDVAAVADFLAKGADVHAKGGAFDWEPLLYAAYSRLDSEAEEHSTLEAARLLVEHGADPNAGFLWEGATCRAVHGSSGSFSTGRMRRLRAARRTFSRFSCITRFMRIMLIASSCSSRTAPTPTPGTTQAALPRTRCCKTAARIWRKFCVGTASTSTTTTLLRARNFTL